MYSIYQFICKCWLVLYYFSANILRDDVQIFDVDYCDSSLHFFNWFIIWYMKILFLLESCNCSLILTFHQLNVYRPL